MLAIITARAGSKRFPHKNTAPLHGRPLICYSVEAAAASGAFDEIMVSTDDPTIMSIMKDYPVTVDERPAHLAEDDTRVAEVVTHILVRKRPAAQTAMLLLPTSPFRTARDITAAVTRFKDGYDSLLSITQYPVPPQFALRMGASALESAYDIQTLRARTQKQALEKLYYPNYAIQLARRDTILRYKSFFGEYCGWIEIPPLRAVDIDTDEDLQWAEYLLTNGLIKLDHTL